MRRAGNTEAARLIKNHRSLQLMDFSKPASAKITANETGFALVFKDPNYQPTKEEKVRLDRFAMMMTEGFFFPAYSDEPNMGNFLKQCYEDWFDLDDISIETRRRRDFVPLSFHLIDPKYIKPIVPTLNQAIPRWDADMLTPFIEDPDLPPSILEEKNIQY